MHACLHIGKWSNPEITGQPAPLAGGFIMEKISNARAILFGGLETDFNIQNPSLTTHGIVYLLDISTNTVVCVLALIHTYTASYIFTKPMQFL